MHLSRSADAARSFRAFVVAAVLLLASSGVGAAQTPPATEALTTNDPRALYDAAFDRWRTIPRAPYATYEMDFRAIRGSKTTVRREQVAYRHVPVTCLVVGVPLDARDRPDAPNVTTRCFAPDSSFTFVPNGEAPGVGLLPVDATTPAPQATDEPKTIGRVTARARAYDVAYVGDEEIAGVRTAHLTLRAYRDPQNHVLHDIWIDRATRGVARMHGTISLTAHAASVDFVVEYDETPTTQLVRRVSGYAKAQVLLLKIGGDFVFTLTHAGYPATLPDWYFAKNGWREHRSPPIVAP
jgi:hypothetical protein